MENGYEILWTDLALEELEGTIEYLENEFSQSEIDILGDEIERITAIISHNPTIFPFSDKLKVRKVVILKFNTLYYRVVEEAIEITSFFSNRQSPETRKF